MSRRHVRLRSPQLRSAALHLFTSAKAAGKTNHEAARVAGVSPTTAWRYRRRAAAKGLDGLNDQPRPGRPTAVRRLGLSKLTLELAQAHRLNHPDKPAAYALRCVLDDPKCRRSDARILLPYARGRRPLPEALAKALALTSKPMIQISCGRFSKLLTR